MLINFLISFILFCHKTFGIAEAFEMIRSASFNSSVLLPNLKIKQSITEMKNDINIISLLKVSSDIKLFGRMDNRITISICKRKFKISFD